MKENISEMIQDELLETVSGGNDAQYDEILQYIKSRDPLAYDDIQSKQGQLKLMYIVRYLYDHGIPVVMVSDFGGDNCYTLGSLDPVTKRIKDINEDISHAELMAMLHSTLG